MCWWFPLLVVGTGYSFVILGPDGKVILGHDGDAGAGGVSGIHVGVGVDQLPASHVITDGEG